MKFKLLAAIVIIIVVLISIFIGLALRNDTAPVEPSIGFTP